jgi:hypothetical protein
MIEIIDFYEIFIPRINHTYLDHEYCATKRAANEPKKINTAIQMKRI